MIRKLLYVAALMSLQSFARAAIIGPQAVRDLTPAEKTALQSKNVAFFHASVGGNMVEGAAALGIPFQEIEDGSYFAPTGTAHLAHLVYGTGDLNGFPELKLNAYDSSIRTGGIGAKVQLAGGKFCWDDMPNPDPLGPPTDLPALQRQYSAMIAGFRRDFPAMRIFHVTTPIMNGDRAADNGIRLAWGDWLKSTYGAGSDVILDLAAVESTEADNTTVCRINPLDPTSLLKLCNSWALGANTAPAPDSHLNAQGQQRAARALLYALHEATKDLPPAPVSVVP